MIDCGCFSPGEGQIYIMKPIIRNVLLLLSSTYVLCYYYTPRDGFTYTVSFGGSNVVGASLIILLIMLMFYPVTAYALKLRHQ